MAADGRGDVATKCRCGFDEAVGVMEKTPEGRMAVTHVTLRPAITYEGRRPTDAERDAMHHEAHEEFFIANSVKTDVTVVEADPA